MPFVKRPDDLEERRGGAPGTLTPTSPAPLAAPQPGKGSGDFVNIQRYMSANKEASDRTAQQLSGSVEQAGQGAKSAVDDASKQFATDAAKGALAWRQPGADAATPAYGGPANMTEHRGFGELQQKVSDAAARAKTATTGYGLQAQMQERNQGAGYTGGQGALDAALVGGAGGRRFHQLRQQYGGLQGYLEQANKASGELAQRMGEDAESARSDYQAVRDGEAVRAEEAKAAAEAEAQRQADQAAMRENAGAGDLQNSTVSINDEKQAMNEGLYYEWLDAGSPPYEEWKASRGG